MQVSLTGNIVTVCLRGKDTQKPRTVQTAKKYADLNSICCPRR